jgi:hypothetical protein
MTPEVAERCFEPYFSTKGRAIATGMGLSMVRGLIESGGGKIEVSSAPGSGATFTLFLPMASPQPSGAKSVPTPDTVNLSIKDTRAGAIASMVLSSLEMPIRRLNDAVPSEGTVWIAEDPSESGLKAYFASCPSGHAIVLTADPAAVHPTNSQPGTVTVLPLRVTPSALRKALAQASSTMPN